MVVLIALLCLWISPLAAQAFDRRVQSADTLIKEALAAYQSGQLETAVDKLRQAHKAAPANPTGVSTWDCCCIRRIRAAWNPKA